jgi:glucokinase
VIAAIEIGGTKLQLAVADEAPAGMVLVERIRLPVDRDRGAQGILQQIETSLNQLRTRHSLAAIGVGFGGPCDVAKGRTIISHQVTGWQDFPLVAWCTERWALPTFIGNDCNVAALAEAKLGAGRGLNRMLFVTVGTGIGGGLVIDGRIDGADRPAVAEVGHLRPTWHSISAQDTIEALASGLGMERVAAAAIADPRAWGVSADVARQLLQPPRSAAGLNLGQAPVRPPTAAELGAAAAAGHPLAEKILEQAATVLGWGLAQATTLTSPERIAIGGGVSLMGESYFERLRRAWRQFVFPPLADACDLVPAELGEDVVVYGAALLAHG